MTRKFPGASYKAWNPRTALNKEELETMLVNIYLEWHLEDNNERNTDILTYDYMPYSSYMPIKKDIYHWYNFKSGMNRFYHEFIDSFHTDGFT